MGGAALFSVRPKRGGAWRSLVAHLLWEQGVAGSNPAAPTTAGNPLLSEIRDGAFPRMAS